MKFEAHRDFARHLDASDPLRGFRNRFHFPKLQGKDALYFCGNSLGLQPKNTQAAIASELTDWQNLGVMGHVKEKNPWVSYHEFLLQNTATLVGAKVDEVVNMNSLSVNLHLLMVSFYRPNQTRFKILVEGGAFPSDLYAVKSQIAFHGFDPKAALLELIPRSGEHNLRTEDILATIEKEGDSIALILIGGVHYLTGQAFDLKTITTTGHKKGCIVGFDLAHAAGNLALNLHEAGCDFAAWCSYKYLNSGPGGLAGAFVHERHARTARPRFAGWWGHNKERRFLFEPDFDPVAGAQGWQLSNPPIFQAAALRASLEIFREAGIANLRAKSIMLTGYLEYLLDSLDHPALTQITPRNPDERGAQLSIMVDGDGEKFLKSLYAQGIIGDLRRPNIIRLSPAPLYNSFEDVFDLHEGFKEVLKDF